MKEKIVKGKCIDLSFEGKGVLKTEEGIVFVDGLFIGEEAEVKILYTRNGAYFGKVNRLITKSPDRIQPLCGVCTACGGCQFQQLSYKAQLPSPPAPVVVTLITASSLIMMAPSTLMPLGDDL